MTTSTTQAGLTQVSVSSPLVSGETLLATLFPVEENRPCARTLARWKNQGLIPFVKIGRMVFFDPVKVQRAIDKQFTVTEIS